MMSRRSRAVMGSIAGNALEWYDFMVFSYLVPVISAVFFGGAGHRAVLFTTILFGMGFLTRPLGGVVLGLFADRHGTGRAMVLGMSVMAVSLLLIACAPGGHTAGLAGAGIGVVARLLQGFSAGAEFATSTSFLIEEAPPGRRGFYGSWQMVGQAAAQILGSGVGFMLATALSPEMLVAWGWRLPFAFGLVILPAILVLRRNGQDTGPRPARDTLRDSAVRFLRDLRRQKGRALSVAGLVGGTSATLYILYGYNITFATRTLHLPIRMVFFITMAAAVVMVPFILLAGCLGDRFGGRRVLFVSLIGLLIAIIPLSAFLVAGPSVGRLLIMQVGLAVFSGLFLGAYSTVVTEVFEPGSRTTVLATVHNMTVMLVGGTSQTIVTWLLAVTGSAMASGLYVAMALLGATLGAGWLAAERRPARRMALSGAEPAPAPVPVPVHV